MYNRFTQRLMRKFNVNLFLFNCTQVAIILILDVLTNFIIGIIYMLPMFTGTTMANFLLKCPIALSPFILVGELILMIIYFVITGPFRFKLSFKELI